MNLSLLTSELRISHSFQPQIKLTGAAITIIIIAITIFLTTNSAKVGSTSTWSQERDGNVQSVRKLLKPTRRWVDTSLRTIPTSLSNLYFRKVKIFMLVIFILKNFVFLLNLRHFAKLFCRRLNNFKAKIKISGVKQ